MISGFDWSAADFFRRLTEQNKFAKRKDSHSMSFPPSKDITR